MRYLLSVVGRDVWILGVDCYVRMGQAAFFPASVKSLVDRHERIDHLRRYVGRTWTVGDVVSNVTLSSLRNGRMITHLTSLSTCTILWVQHIVTEYISCTML